MSESAKPASPFTPLPAHVNLPEIDADVLKFWAERDVFGQSLRRTTDGEPWVFYEGPPTANGKPGTHHVEARVFKDIFPRFKTMKGYHVPRKAGWDCHGLPVEIAVEKELGFSGKADIERYGIAEFNDRCRDSVQRHVAEFVEMTTRMGYWVDLENPYRTMSPEYVDSVWWSLKQIFDKGLLAQDYRVAPYCPRCGTGLSDHEVAQGYEDITDPSVYVRFPITSGEWTGKADLLVWTTTPWTLVSNTAVAVRSDVTYVVARTDAGTFVVAESLAESVLGEDLTILARMAGKELEKVTYEPPFSLVEIPGAHIVILADYVTTDDGTGLVHQAPAFGADDLASCRAYGLPVVNPIRPDGHFLAEVPFVGGEFFKTADAALVADLKQRGLLFKKLDYTHSYPHCWRCHTPLMYYAQLSWYIRTTQLKEQLLRENERTNWYPDRVKHGRYGDWLSNNIDWALSRERYWGTPLPIWRCEEDHLTCVGSRAELAELAGENFDELDPHRPFVDDVSFDCPQCRSAGRPTSRARRVPEVIDAWYDSGAMPFAQWGYPYVDGSVEKFEQAYPAQYICEAIDQTRGWFYSLMAVGTAVFDRSSYENVVCLGHILAEDGRKMSKHLGNILEPMPLMNQHGADVLRWFMLTAGSPWAARRVGDNTLEEASRKTLTTYWATASFFTLYASLAPWRENVPAEADRPVLDQWLLAELRATTATVDEALERFDTAAAGRVLTSFIDNVSNWYVRRSRARFWAAEPACLATLHTCLDTLTRLLAPFVPFVTERVWQAVVRPADPNAPESVHLAEWPGVTELTLPASTEPRDEELRTRMALVRSVVEAGRAARTAAKVKIRQPLSRAMVAAPGWADLPPELAEHVTDELNVVGLATLEAAGELVDVTVKPNFRELGRRFGSRTQLVAKALGAVDPAAAAAALREAGELTVQVEGASEVLLPTEVLITETPRSGWAVVSEHGVTVALDTEITPELRRAGLAREAIRFIQEERKRAGLEITDRIRLWWEADGETASAVAEHGDAIAEAVLAVELTAGKPAESRGDELVATDLGLRVWLVKAA